MMFDKVKNLHKLRKAQSEIEKQMDQINAVKEKSGVKVVVNANNKIIVIEVDGNEDKLLKDLINDALKEAKKKAEKKLRGQISELGLGDLI
jgi:DNA-binding protein YbaB